MAYNKAPLIAHVIHRLAIGGLENGLINLINHIQKDKYRHVIICLTESSEFSDRIIRDDITIYELKKSEGKDVGLYLRLWKLLRKIRPDIVHSRNLSTIEASLVAALAGVPIRIHSEHGRDIFELDGKHRRYIQLRRFFAPFIHQYIALSKDLQNWLVNEVKINRKKVVQLYNGVDTERFHTAGDEKATRHHMPLGFADSDTIVIGTVGRLEVVKDQLTLVKAFIELQYSEPDIHVQLRLVLFGDGSLRPKIESMVYEAGIQDQIWLAGSREDVPKILHELDIFVLPSLNEGISNTILEAMASGLPVVATKVGGNPELVQEGVTGTLVSADDPKAMAEVLRSYVVNPKLGYIQGRAGRQRVEEFFSLTAMMQCYQAVYDNLLSAKGLKS